MAGVAQGIECWSANQRVDSLIPGQGTCLGCGPGPQWGTRERQPHTDVSLPLLEKSKRKEKTVTKEKKNLYHVGDSQHTENVQINKVIGASEKKLVRLIFSF